MVGFYFNDNKLYTLRVIDNSPGGGFVSVKRHLILDDCIFRIIQLEWRNKYKAFQ